MYRLAESDPRRIPGFGKGRHTVSTPEECFHETVASVVLSFVVLLKNRDVFYLDPEIA